MYIYAVCQLWIKSYFFYFQVLLAILAVCATGIWAIESEENEKSIQTPAEDRQWTSKKGNGVKTVRRGKKIHIYLGGKSKSKRGQNKRGNGTESPKDIESAETETQTRKTPELTTRSDTGMVEDSLGVGSHHQVHHIKEKIKIKHHHHHHHHNHVKTVVKKEPYPVEKIVEKVVHVPKPYPVEKIVEKVVHVPVEKVVHVPKPYPVDRIVEKIVHVPKPYPVEKIVEKPVHIEKNVPFEVKVPYPVEKIIHVEKRVPVEKIVEKIVHVPQPYPVYKHIHIPVEVKVPFEVEKKVPYPVKVEVEKKIPYPVKIYVPQPSHAEKKPPHHPFTFNYEKDVNFADTKTHNVEIPSHNHAYHNNHQQQHYQQQHHQQQQQQQRQEKQQIQNYPQYQHPTDIDGVPEFLNDEDYRRSGSKVTKKITKTNYKKQHQKPKSTQDNKNLQQPQPQPPQQYMHFGQHVQHESQKESQPIQQENQQKKNENLLQQQSQSPLHNSHKETDKVQLHQNIEYHTQHQYEPPYQSQTSDFSEKGASERASYITQKTADGMEKFGTAASNRHETVVIPRAYNDMETQASETKFNINVPETESLPQPEALYQRPNNADVTFQMHTLPVQVLQIHQINSLEHKAPAGFSLPSR